MTSIMETKKEYIAPELTAVSVKAERGYAASLPIKLSVVSDLLGFPTEGVFEEWGNTDQSLTEDNGFTWS